MKKKQGRARAGVRVLKLFLFASLVMLPVGQPVFGVGGVQPPGYTEGMKVDKDGMVRALDTDVKITFPNGVAVKADNIGAEKELYISYRTDTPACVGNVCGGGTKLDPYDGSTSVKLIAAILNAPSGSTVHLAPGSYTNAGQITVPAGVALRGAGKSKTIITRTGGSQAVQVVCTGDNIEVSDLTIDVNGTALAYTNAGVQFRGNNAKIKNVRVTRCSGPTQESFPMVIWATTASMVGAEIDNCEVDNFTGINGTMIFMGSDSNDTTKTVTGVVRDCYVHDCPAIAYGAAGTLNAKFVNNYSYNCYNAFNQDSFLNTNIELIDNKFMKCSTYGIHMVGVGAGNTLTNAIISGNTVEIDSATTGGFAAFAIAGENASNIEITYNTAYFSGAAVHPDQQGFLVNINSNLTFKGNHASALTRNIVRINSADVMLADKSNNNLDGSPLYANPSNVLPRTLVPFIENVFQGGNADLGNVVTDNVSGNGSLLTQLQARNIEVGRRSNPADTNVVYNNADVVVIITGPNTTAHTVSLGSASGNNGRFLYLFDQSGDISTHPYTANTKGGGFAFNINNGRVTFYSDGTDWVLWDLFTPP